MKNITVFQDHYGCKTTVVAGQYATNGCQFFHKDDAHKVFTEFSVPYEQQQDVLNSFSDENPTIDELIEVCENVDNNIDCDALADFICHMTTDINILSGYIDDANHCSISYLIKTGNKEIIDMFLSSDNQYYRREVVYNSTDKEFLCNISETDPYLSVRSAANFILMRLDA